MPFKKGKSGNPNGRPKGSNVARSLDAAIKRVEKEKGVDFWDHVAEQAYEDRAVLMKLIDKFVPNLKQVDKNVESKLSGTIKLAWKK